MSELNTPSQDNAPQATEAVIAENPSFKERVINFLAKPSAPIWAGVGLVALVAGGFLYVKAPVGLALPFSRPSVVTFDPVKFTNAQRAVASILAVRPDADASLTLTQVAKQAESVIQEEARGAVVLVKQAVVAPAGIPDITDAVLERFGLPTNAPTITTDLVDESLEGVAPTNSAFSNGKLREDYRLELEAKRERLAAEQARQQGQENILP